MLCNAHVNPFNRYKADPSANSPSPCGRDASTNGCQPDDVHHVDKGGAAAVEPETNCLLVRRQWKSHQVP